VWCAVPSRDGQTIYFGTGDQGKIFAVDTKVPRAGDEHPARKIAVSTPPGSRRCGAQRRRAAGGDDPRRAIYTVDPKKRRRARMGHIVGRPCLEPGLRRAHGRHLRRHRSPGKVFAIDDKAHTRELWDSGDKHVVSLRRSDGGAAAAGGHVRRGVPLRRAAGGVTGASRRR